MNTRILLTLLLLLATAIFFVVGQTKPSSRKVKDMPVNQGNLKAVDTELTSQQVEIENFITRANGQPVEIAADILFVLLAKDLVKDRNRKEVIVEDIFRRASEAVEPYKMSQREGLTDTRSGFRSMAFDLDLDRLSIQLRAVKLMLGINKLKARGLFQEISPLKLKALSCEENLDYEISEYYRILRNVVEETFDAESIERQEHIYFAAEHIASLDSPAQIRPMIDFITSLKITSQQFNDHVDRLALSLRKVSVQPRSFAYSLKYGGVTERLKSTLLPRIEQKKGSPETISKAYRSYLLKHLSATQCADDLMTGQAEKPHPLIARANTLFTVPLDEDEIKPEKIEPGVKVFQYWSSPKSGRLLMEIKKLRFGTSKTELSVVQKSDQQWHGSLLRFLDEMNNWRSDDEANESDYINQKSVLYQTLLEIVPPDAVMRETVLREYAIFLRDSPTQKEIPSQWLHSVKILLKLQKSLPADKQKEFIDSLSTTGTQVFPLYFELENLKRPVSNQNTGKSIR